MNRFKWSFLLVLFFSTVFVWSVVWQWSVDDELKIYFLDVGQGDAIFIQAPNRNQVLIDGGRNKSLIRSLSAVMPFYDRSLDLIIATHPDLDHIGGLPFVLDRFTVGAFMDPGVTVETLVFRALEESLERNEVQVLEARRGMRLVLDEGVFLDILFPDRDVSRLDPNDASVIARLVYGQTAFMLTGDAPKKIEKYLVELDGQNLKSDVLKAGHHGSRTSTDILFAGFVAPTYGVISAGANNSYGHPHPEVLSVLADLDVVVVSTAEMGTIKFTSDGRRVRLISDY